MHPVRVVCAGHSKQGRNNSEDVCGPSKGAPSPACVSLGGRKLEHSNLAQEGCAVQESALLSPKKGCAVNKNCLEAGREHAFNCVNVQD